MTTAVARRPWLAYALLFGSLGGVASVAAQPLQSAPQPAPPPAADRDYDSIIGEAVREFDAGHWEEARALFLRAHAQKPSARTLRGVGFVEYELRHYVAADHALRRSLTDPTNPLTEQQRGEVDQVLARAQSFLGRYRIESEPAAVSIVVDGAAAEREADGSLLVEVGTHTLSFSAPAHATHEQQVDVRGGEHETLRIVLPLLEAAAAAAAGPSSGNGGDSRLRQPVWPWIAVGAGAGVAVAGGILLALGLHDVAKVENVPDGTTWSSIEGARNRAPALTGTGIALGVVGLGAVGVGVVWLLKRDQPSEHANARIAFGPAGLQIGGAF